MKITYKIGDLLEAEEKVILHGCNGRGVMGSGVAKAIRAAYPIAFEKYREALDKDRKIAPGTVIPVFCGRHIIINAVTQDDFGYDKTARYVSYDAVADCLRKVNDWPYWRENEARIAMPKIGAGLGGGSWPIIAAIIEDTLKAVAPTVYVIDDGEML